MKPKTNLGMLIFGMKHIAENHGLHFDESMGDGNVCIYGGCNIPTLCDVELLCEDCGLPKENIESSEFGIDVYLPSEEWADTLYKKPAFGELWKKVQH